MSNVDHKRIMREAALEWGLSAAETTLSFIDSTCPGRGVNPYLLELHHRIAERAASLVDEGIDEDLANLWEETAREVIGHCLAAHDEGLAAECVRS